MYLEKFTFAPVRYHALSHMLPICNHQRVHSRRRMVLCTSNRIGHKESWLADDLVNEVQQLLAPHLERVKAAWCCLPAASASLP